SYYGRFWVGKQFNARAIYDVKLRVRSTDGCLDSLTKQVWFYPAMEPRFSVPEPAQCFNEHSFVFDASASTVPLGTIIRYEWKYEDGDYATGTQSPAKRFATFDTFTVNLVTTSNEFCQDSTESEVI